MNRLWQCQKKFMENHTNHFNFNNGTFTNYFLKHTQDMVVSNANHWWGWNKTILMSGNKNIYFFAVIWLHSKSRNDEVTKWRKSNAKSFRIRKWSRNTSNRINSFFSYILNSRYIMWTSDLIVFFDFVFGVAIGFITLYRHQTGSFWLCVSDWYI